MTRLQIALLIAGISLVAYAGADERVQQTFSIDVPSQPLDTALNQLAEQTKMQFVLYSQEGKGITAPRITGTLTAEEALSRMLSNTGLSFTHLDEHTIAIRAKDSTSTLLPRPIEGSSPDIEQTPQKEPVRLEEVVVTAQKKTELLLDVPVAVSVLNGVNLADNGQVLLADYASYIPSLQVTPRNGGNEAIQIRGISTLTVGGLINPTVAVAVDGVPYGGSWNYSFAGGIPDIDPGDLARVEVLRGPQGTLYGSDSLGGLINFVTVDPSTAGFSGRVEAGTNSVHNGAEPGYNFRGSLNVPISEHLAVRASAFTRQDPGYVDNPVLGIKGINEGHDSGGRLGLLWRASDTVSLKLSALYEDATLDGESAIDVPTTGYPKTLGLGELEQNAAPGTGISARITQAYSAILNLKLGDINVTSTTGYNINQRAQNLDYTDFFSTTTAPNYGTPDSINSFFVRNNKFDQELRAASSIGARADWLLGGFYTTERTTDTSLATAVEPISGAGRGVYYINAAAATLNEAAIFGDLTLHVLPRFDLQVGARESFIHEDEADVSNGLLENNVPVTESLPKTHATAFTYLVTPQYKVSADVLAYMRFSSGYRPGVPNFPAANGQPLPASAGPDMTYNYELGIKGSLLDHRLIIDASAYYIDWRNIQLPLFSQQAGSGYTSNAGGAKSDGLEVSLEARPISGLTLSGWISWDQAVLLSSLPSSSPSVANAGDRLPDSPRFSGFFATNYEFPLASGVRGFLGGAVSYVGDRQGDFAGANYDGAHARENFPSYAKLDLRAGAKYNDWTINFYANNVGDKRAILSSGAGSGLPYVRYFITPRTVGVNVIRAF